MRVISVTVTILFVYFCFTEIMAQSRWSVDLKLGDAFIFNSPLTINQRGFGKSKLSADYTTDSFTQPYYYAFKLSRWNGKKAWEIEILHLKIYLNNKTAWVQRFNISHGYNFLLVNRVLLIKGFEIRPGAGIIIAHPENTVRGKQLDEKKGIFGWGYYISGPALQLAAASRMQLPGNLFFGLEAKFTASYIQVPVADGDASVSLYAIHGLFGLSYEF